MFLTDREIKELNEKGLKDFLEKKIQEGYYLDYKRGLSGKSDKEQYREFLKDVTGFANAHGGQIIIGAEEPSENLSIESQLVGVQQGDKLAMSLERVASSSIDPRIAGLQVKFIPLSNGNCAIVVHIPPSLGRPHMVNHDGHRTFYIRHTESTNPMSTHEIRESVFASASAEARAKEYLGRMEKDVREYVMQGAPVFLLQAMPIMPFEQPWDVLDKKIREVFVGQQRQSKYDHRVNLAFGNIVPTIEGIKSEKNDQDHAWVIEAHRNGYIAAVYHNKKHPEIGNLKAGYYIHENLHGMLFRAFCDICSELTNAVDADSPYVLRCKYLNATDTQLLYFSGRDAYTREPYSKKDIIWPDQIRQIGEKLELVADKWMTQLFHAFGIEGPIR